MKRKEKTFLESFVTRRYRKISKMKCVDKVCNENVTRRIRETRDVTRTLGMIDQEDRIFIETWLFAKENKLGYD